MDLYLMPAVGVLKTAAAAIATDPARDQVMRLFSELSGPLRRYLLCAGASAEDADEAVQESFLKLYVHLVRAVEPANKSAWVFQVARNYWRDVKKSAHRKRSVPIDGPTIIGDVVIEPGGSPEMLLLRDERSQRLSTAIARLPDQERECILLRSAGLRYREIAEILAIDTNRAGVLLNRAVARLRKELS